ncbi:hypothetical protein OESDEN_15123 [Oesophagostomum dentatum]|uniref:Secreted protein n=1 Tax=Oesophagostomum dentatum TaxID=61180 RepID=A0A0B1SPS7_OESDE|nr:hypothetical protein OESDEN_15123 [Oesophagostomum dentatum]
MWFVFFFLSLIACSFASNEDNLSEEFCRQFPSLHLCRLHDTLQGSLLKSPQLFQWDPWKSASRPLFASERGLRTSLE